MRYIPTVTEQELQAMRVGWFYRLTDINQPDLFKYTKHSDFFIVSHLHQVTKSEHEQNAPHLPGMPEHVVPTEVGVYESTFVI